MKFGIGQPASRVEDQRFLTGKGSYVDDIALPGILIGHALRSPVAHARITALDVAEARALPGVHAVYTHAETAHLGPVTFRMPLKQTDGSDLATVLLPRLADGVVRYVGQPVAWIVAETRDIARDAAELIEVDYDDLPVMVTPEAALAPGAPALHEGAPGNLAYDWDVGDAAATEAAFAGATHIARVSVVNQRVVVNPMEPRGILVRYLPETESWEAWTGNQGAHSARDNLARGLGVPSDKVRCHTPDVGGGFGMKLMDHPEYPLAALAAKDTGRPVKWVGDRSESFLADAQGRDLASEAEGAFDAQGRLLALRVSSISNLGAYYSSSGPGVHTLFSAPLLGGMYDVPVFHHRVRGVLTNTTPTDAYRGAGRPEVIHVTEQVMEAAVAVTGIDGAELRRRNLIRPAQIPYRTHGGFLFDSADPEANLDRTLAAIDYTGFPARRAESASRGKLRGISVSYYFERTGGGPNENATILVNTDGSVDTAVGTQSTGQGHETAWAQIVHEKLGLPFGSIRLAAGDSDRLPLGGGTGGSRSLIMASRVFILAAEDVIAQGLERAADRLEAAPADIAFSAEEGGVFRIAGTDRTVSLLELAADEAIFGQGRVGDSTSTFPNGCHAAEVEVDPETGHTAYLRHVVTDDFGVIVNPLLAAGQVHGGIAQGAGQVLGEAAVWDPETGQPLAGSFMDYAMPRAADLPMFETGFNEVPSTTNPLGVKGCGEAGSVGALPALALAVQNALASAGVTLARPPYTPQAIWTALQGAA
ncbi:xanthine dehydrogenase family protein molybdopterin-binding subunit [Oceanicella sp. SM1341]|uniref:xanthine dehydrogenase family protein molybdopterin-binding subunit n=1 Tax=Oceanicella sp. SM1341 TaxID=1548889 RepID=UPI0018E4F936|nr:xanthine dehydrogenase family protein molybdopterin-binding subunit [Oceanicella sp. SM1341]